MWIAFVILRSRYTIVSITDLPSQSNSPRMICLWKRVNHAKRSSDLRYPRRLQAHHFIINPIARLYAIILLRAGKRCTALRSLSQAWIWCSEQSGLDTGPASAMLIIRAHFLWSIVECHLKSAPRYVSPSWRGLALASRRWSDFVPTHNIFQNKTHCIIK